MKGEAFPSCGGILVAPCSVLFWCCSGINLWTNPSSM